MERTKNHELFYDWNENINTDIFKGFVDETLRDGLQSIDYTGISLEEKIQIIKYIDCIPWITDVIIGMVNVSEKNNEIIKALLKEAKNKHFQTWILCRADKNDIDKVMEIKKQNTYDVGIDFFISASDARLYVENWSVNNVLERIDYCCRVSKVHFKHIRFSIEDATRTKPETLLFFINKLINYGIERITIADTAGTSDPTGVASIFTFINKSFPNLMNSKLEWHGHNDRGLATANSIASIKNGCHYVHGTMLGMGERNGNAPLDIMMCNLYEKFDKNNQWEALRDYYNYCQGLFGNTQVSSYPYFGKNSNCTATGTHSTAIFKALKKGDENLAKLMYTVPNPINKSLLETIYISPLSGKKSIMLMLDLLDYSYDNDIVDLFLKEIKTSDEILDINKAKLLYDKFINKQP